MTSTRVRSDAIAGMYRIGLWHLLFLIFKPPRPSIWALNRGKDNAHKPDGKTVQATTFDTPLQWHHILLSCFSLKIVWSWWKRVFIHDNGKNESTLQAFMYKKAPNLCPCSCWCQTPAASCSMCKFVSQKRHQVKHVARTASDPSEPSISFGLYWASKAKCWQWLN